MQRIMLLIAILTASVALSYSTAPSPVIECATFSAGGIQTTDGGAHVLGQFGVGFAMSGHESVELGVVPCWRTPGDVPLPGDGDADGDVDLEDHSGLVNCLDGPDLAPIMNCQSFDFDDDSRIDLHDFSVLMRGFTGS